MSDGTLTELGMREPRERPNHDAIRTMVESAVTNSSVHWTRIADARQVLLAERPDRTGDGFKPLSASLQGGPEEKPWEADVDVRLAAEVVVERVNLLRQAVAQGGLSAVPVEGGDARAAALAQMEMMWWLNGPMRRNVHATLAEAAKWQEAFGSYVVGLEWRERRQVVARRLVLADLYTWAVEQGSRDFMAALEGALTQGVEVSPAEGAALSAELEGIAEEVTAEMEQALYDRTQLDELAATLAYYDERMCAGEAMRVARALQRGLTEVDYCGYEVVESRPHWKGLRPGVDVLFPSGTEDISEAEWVVEPLWLTARQVRERAAAEGWDAQWTEELLKKPGTPYGLMSDYGADYPWLLTGAEVGLAVPYEVRQTDYFCPVLLTYRAASKAGEGCIYRTLVHDGVPGAAMHEMVDTVDGLMPYESFRRDSTERLLLGSGGLVDLVAGYQEQLRCGANGWFDYVQKFINPVILKPTRFSQENARSLFRPGAEFTYGRREEVPQYMTPPVLGAVGLGEGMDRYLRMNVARQFGLRHPEVPPETVQAIWQVSVDDFMHCAGLLMRRTYAMVQMWGPEEIALRVTGRPGVFAGTAGGVRPQAAALRREEVRGSFDFALHFDTRNLVLDWAEARWKGYAAALSVDTVGAVPRVPILVDMLSTINPALAGTVLSAEEADTRQVQRTAADMAAIISGQEPPFELGQNHALALSYAQEQIQKSPLLQQMMQNEQIAAVMENYLNQHSMQVKQEENKQTGLTGGRPVLSGGLAGNGQ